jgi:hypothetical protein
VLRIRGGRRFWRRDEGATVVEFALVAPLLFLIVFGIIDFSRAYARLNTMNAAMREGARYGAALARPDTSLGLIKAEVARYSSVWGLTLDTSSSVMSATFDGYQVQVSVNDYPIPLITPLKFISLDSLRVTRTVGFRWERAAP